MGVSGNVKGMVTKVDLKTTAMEAEATASLFLSERLPDRLTPGEPRFDADAEVWRVPVLLAYPVIGPVGQAGEILVGASSNELVSHTPINDILESARSLYESNREKIEAIVL
jgi:hypothetical protein